MDLYSSILSRRSIRLFTQEEISNEQTEKILEAGLSAPSSKNSNPWYLVGLKGSSKDKLISLLDKLQTPNVSLPIDPITGRAIATVKDTTLASINIVKKAPLLIFIFNNCPYSKGEKSVIETNNLEVFHDYVIEMIGVGAAIENMLLAAHALDLGGVCLRDLNIYEKEVKTFFDVKYDLIAALAIGRPAHQPGSKKLRKDLIKIIG